MAFAGVDSVVSGATGSGALALVSVEVEPKKSLNLLETGSLTTAGLFKGAPLAFCEVTTVVVGC